VTAEEAGPPRVVKVIKARYAGTLSCGHGARVGDRIALGARGWVCLPCRWDEVPHSAGGPRCPWVPWQPCTCAEDRARACPLSATG